MAEKRAGLSIEASHPLHSQARLPLEELKRESFHVTHCPEFALLDGCGITQIADLRNLSIDAARVKFSALILG